MLINLSEILSILGESREYDVNLEISSISFMGSDYTVADTEPVYIRISNQGKRVLSLYVKTKLCLVGACSRCLAPVRKTYSVLVDREIDLDVKDTDALDDYDELSYIKDCDLDVDELIKNELYSMIPLQLLCKESCLGICKVCGGNRNITSCECKQTMPDPRMAVFDDIFNQFKEV